VAECLRANRPVTYRPVTALRLFVLLISTTSLLADEEGTRRAKWKSLKKQKSAGGSFSE
jgi:hypothetical protein